MPFKKGNTIGFKKGETGNPDGMGKVKHIALKWEVIDGYISEAVKKASRIVEGTHPDILAIKDPKDRLELILKATGHLLKLAPQRQAGENGGPVVFTLKSYE